MKRRPFYLVFVLIVVCTTLVISVSAQGASTNGKKNVSGQWTYTLNNGTARITAYSGTATSITIPDTLDGYRVAAIGDSLFANNSQLTNVSFNKSLESIGREAFRNCTGLTSITLPESLESLGFWAFNNCSNLSTITINSRKLGDLSNTSCFKDAGKYAANGITVIFGNEVTRIPGHLFNCDQSNYARIRVVKMSPSIRTISEKAFFNCFDLESISWGSNLISIQSEAFRNCTSLASVTLPESLETLGFWAFNNCTNLSSITINSIKLSDLSNSACFENAGKYSANGIVVTFGNKVSRIPQHLFNCDGDDYARIKTVKMGSAITTIAEKAFYNCFDLISVTWGSHLTSIDSEAFRNCTSLPSITLPESLETLGFWAFNNCTNLSSIAINSKKLNDLSNSSCFRNAGKNTPNGITVTFGNEVTRIPQNLFNCDEDYYARIKAVKIGSSIATIAEKAFYNCFDLNSVTWGNSLVSIQSEAFRNCTSLSSISLPESLDTLGFWAFNNCTNLSSITINSRKLGDLSNSSCFSNAGKKATNGIAVTFGDAVSRVPKNMFNCDQGSYARIRTIKMGSSITRICESAFENCLDVESVTMGSNVATIDSNAFYNCVSINRITLPASVSSIGFRAFAYCNKLTRVDVYNYNCSFSDYSNTVGIPGTAVIYGYRNSTAQTYASKYGYSFVPIDRFTDVPANAYYAPAVAWAVENGVTSGTTSTTFSPGTKCTRAQVVTFLWRAAGSPKPKNSRNPFKDVKSSAYYYNAVLWAVENNITSGTSASTFSPDASCTRGQVVAFLWRYEGEPAPSNSRNPFKDVKSGSFYYTAVLWAVGRGVTSGTSSITFAPSATCTRGQVVTFLYRDIENVK